MAQLASHAGQTSSALDNSLLRIGLQRGNVPMFKPTLLGCVQVTQPQERLLLKTLCEDGFCVFWLDISVSVSPPVRLMVSERCKNRYLDAFWLFSWACVIHFERVGQLVTMEWECNVSSCS